MEQVPGSQGNIVPSNGGVPLLGTQSPQGGKMEHKTGWTMEYCKINGEGKAGNVEMQQNCLKKRATLWNKKEAGTSL